MKNDPPLGGFFYELLTRYYQPLTVCRLFSNQREVEHNKGMILMESKRKIRSRYRQGQPIREIERETGISRNTIKKYIHAKTLDDSEYKRGIQPHRALGGYMETLEKILRDSRQQKRERKAIFIYNELCMQGYIGSYSAVGRYVTKWRRDNKVQAKSGAYIPLAFRPGEAYQFDWNSETILLNGILTKIKVAQTPATSCPPHPAPYTASRLQPL